MKIKKNRLPVRFTATVKVMITDSVKRKRSTYYRLVPLPPFENPVLGKLRKLLYKQQVAFTEKLIVKDGIEYIYFSTIIKEI